MVGCFGEAGVSAGATAGCLMPGQGLQRATDICLRLSVEQLCGGRIGAYEIDIDVWIILQ